MITVKPPAKPLTTVFLAGSIEMGVAVDWQQAFETEFSGEPDLLILNPRRTDWDSAWVQSIDNPQFRSQVEWELKGLQSADIVAFNFEADTKSPISLYELGLVSKDQKAVVCCPPAFWRYGNIQVICNRFGIPLVETKQELYQEVRERLNA